MLLPAQSRNDMALDRWFPEIAEAARRLPPGTIVESTVRCSRQRSDLVRRALGRLAGRQTGLASLVAFDVLAVGGEDLRRSPFLHRDRRLEDLELTAPLTTSVQTDDRDVAATWLAHPGARPSILELATLAWVEWWNHRGLHGACEGVPPAEFEEAHYRRQGRAGAAA